jgi:hypothetical protein
MYPCAFIGEEEGDEPVILTDILGLEDALGTMDFKGTHPCLILDCAALPFCFVFYLILCYAYDILRYLDLYLYYFDLYDITLAYLAHPVCKCDGILSHTRSSYNTSHDITPCDVTLLTSCG